MSEIKQLQFGTEMNVDVGQNLIVRQFFERKKTRNLRCREPFNSHKPIKAKCQHAT